MGHHDVTLHAAHRT